jgi:hypothetical protein
LVPIISFAYISDPNFNAETKTYGNLKHEIYFNSNSISEKEVDQLAEGLIATTFFDDFQQKTVFTKKEDQKYIIIIPVNDIA